MPKLGDIDAHEFLDLLGRELGREQSEWIAVSKSEGRKLTDGELVTINLLSALRRVIGRVSATYQN